MSCLIYACSWISGSNRPSICADNISGNLSNTVLLSRSPPKTRTICKVMRILSNDEMKQMFDKNHDSASKDFKNFIVPVSTLLHFLSFGRQCYHNWKSP